LSKEIKWDDIPTIEAGIGETYKFEEHGEVVIGEYLGTGTLDTDDGEALYLRFKQEDGKVLAISANYDLKRKIIEGGDSGNPIQEGAMVRIVYTHDTPTSRGQTAMKVFEVRATL
jgi:hypothetical protein